MKEYELDVVLESLRSADGGGTWNISLYIRPDKSIQSMHSRIVQEISEAESIKSDSTKENVQSSLQKIRDVLSRYQQTPDSGLVVFASPDEVTVLDELPFDCPENRYHCDSSFLLEPLESGLDSDGRYGLIVVERGQAAVGVLSRGRVTDVTEKESQVMGKTRAGGQSSERFARIREKQLHEFFKDVAGIADQTFDNLDGVVVGGTLDTASAFVDRYARHDWNVLGSYAVDHGDETGLEELVERAESVILEEEQKENREKVGRFFTALRDGDAEYGEDAVRTKLERGAVDVLLVSSNKPLQLINELSELASQQGGESVVVSDSFEKGKMFDNLGGVGAICRW